MEYGSMEYGVWEYAETEPKALTPKQTEKLREGRMEGEHARQRIQTLTMETRGKNREISEIRDDREIKEYNIEEIIYGQCERWD